MRQEANSLSYSEPGTVLQTRSCVPSFRRVTNAGYLAEAKQIYVRGREDTKGGIISFRQSRRSGDPDQIALDV
jgi:hypothetical protein